jgi:hypothetical protein
VLRVAILAAIAVAAAVAVRQFTGGPIRLVKPEFVPLQYRGSAPTQSAYSSADATACLELLQRVAEAYPQQATEGSPWWKRHACQWRLKIRFQELPEGRFALLVQALDRKSEPAQEWSRDFSNMADFQAKSGDWSREIADQLAALRVEGR